MRIIQPVRATRGLACCLVVGTMLLGAVTLFAESGPTIKVQVNPTDKRATRAVPPITKLSGRSVSNSSTNGNSDVIQLTSGWRKVYHLQAGKTVEISVHIEHPSELPTNGRIAAEWTLANDRQNRQSASIEGSSLANVSGRTADAFGIYTKPTANWRKVLHAVDSDIYLVYRASVTGDYTLQLTPVTDETPVGDAAPRWRERGNAPTLAALPRVTPWNPNTKVPISVYVKPIDIGTAAEQSRSRTIVECEPNDTPEQAQTIILTPGKGDTDVQTWEILGGADDVEFFDNGNVGRSGDDWFRLEYKGDDVRMLTAQISLPNQVITARIRAYKLKAPVSPETQQVSGSKSVNSAKTVVGIAGTRPEDLRLLPITEATDGQDGNERAHQQDEGYRDNICRLLKPGETYFLRVEANAPGYQMQLRLLKPAPYTDPRLAVRQGMYNQIGQVDAWLTNRPRGASIERRLRESGNLLGTGCMSCHTQSGVWGPAVPLTLGYSLENPQNYWHLINVMYECLRPTNELKDAANNTSLAPLDLGDGPAGTRAAGFNIVNLERWRKPSKLHADQSIRTANFVMQTGDPGGINAAGPGSNIGFVIVNEMATEILKAAWEKTGDPKYFHKMEEKAQQVLNVNPQFTDDVALRLDYFNRVFPIKRYVEWVKRAESQDAALNSKLASTSEPKKNISGFINKVCAQLVTDELRLRSIQLPDGSWNFNPGTSQDGGKTWLAGPGVSDPSPTALGITGLTSAGYGVQDPAVVRGVKALLAMQDPSGRWNRAAQTGFVSTAYALHALSRLYPETSQPLRIEDVTPKFAKASMQNSRIQDSSRKIGTKESRKKTGIQRVGEYGTAGETLVQAINRVRITALANNPQFADLLITAAKHDSPLVRYWAMIGLGALHTEKGVPMLVAALGDHVKMVRDAASWGVRQTLLDDKGWTLVLNAAEKGDDYTREAVWQALSMRVDTVMPHARVDYTRLTVLFDHAMNHDSHPAVRAWAAKAAWQWWVWNPPVRRALNQSWVRLLERPESDLEVENSVRYSSQMLFIANGHKANGSAQNQYRELADLFTELGHKLDTDETATRTRLARRLVGIGGTFYATAGGDGGPGQMGYVTPGAGETLGKATLIYLAEAVKDAKNLAGIKAGLEGGSNIPYQPLTTYLVDYSLKAPDEVRAIAASAVSDPRSVSLTAVPELVEPQLAQIKRGAQEPPRRTQVSDPIIDLWSRVNWIIPKREEQQKAFFDLIIPKFDQYVSAKEIAAIADPAQKAQVEREMDANWYLADRLGMVLALNPDLHQEIVLVRYFPSKFKNPLEELYWTRSVEWMLTFTSSPGKTARLDEKLKSQIEDQYASYRRSLCRQTDGKPVVQQLDPTAIIKDRALQLYLDQLRPTADPKTREIAIRMANQTALRTNPEVLRALSDALKFETRPELVTVIQNVLKQSDGAFFPDLIAALKAEKHKSIKFDAKGEPQLTEVQKLDIVYFRDYVLPELTRQKRTDQQSCMGCHGLQGRVPSMQLRAPDKFGYMPVTDLLTDYRILQQRINVADLEKSKLLRKPLNIQNGKEDGHQGGRRYSPTDDGYLLLKHWAENQSRVQ